MRNASRQIDVWRLTHAKVALHFIVLASYSDFALASHVAAHLKVDAILVSIQSEPASTLLNKYLRVNICTLFRRH
jgi:hypothetical protein